jgi:flagellar hook protein FlgE
MPLTSYYTALTGLNNNSFAINVIGDNLANMNTTAFKAGQATFAELLAGVSGTDASGNPISNGLGSAVNGIVHNHTQGTITNTGNSTDAAINGNGFFVVSADGEMAFTRSGGFTFNKEGNLVSADGFQAMGYMGDNGVIDTGGAIVPILLQKGQIIPAAATVNMSIRANLDAQAADGDTYSALSQVYDSLGGSHNITITYTKTGAGAWSWSATIPAEDVGGASGDLPVEIGSGDLAFDGMGILTDPVDNPTLTISGFTNNAEDQDITYNLLDSDGVPLITNYVRESAVSNTAQDGFGASALSSISIDSSGVIMGLTENGRAIPLAQLVLADFPNLEGLQKYQGSTYVAFTSSGEPSIGTAGTGGRGKIVGAALEQSNVDMAQEFVNLIKAQRAYQANSRIISTTDELYQDSLALKR